MDVGIKGRTAIVCASSKGLGFACAAALAAEGAHVVLNGRDEAALAKAAENITSAGGDAIPVAADLNTDQGRDTLLAACPAPDILVTNNGGPPPQSVEALTRQEIQGGLEMNLLSPLELIRAVTPGMATRGFGRVVAITSIAVLMPVAGLGLSSAARAGLTAFTVAMARDLAARNVTINNLLPGYFATDRLMNVFAARAEREGLGTDVVRDQEAGSIPAGRFGTPEEFGDLCAYLCSRQAGYLTGQNVLIDGGLFDRNF